MPPLLQDCTFQSGRAPEVRANGVVLQVGRSVQAAEICLGAKLRISRTAPRVHRHLVLRQNDHRTCKPLEGRLYVTSRREYNRLLLQIRGDGQIASR